MSTTDANNKKMHSVLGLYLSYGSLDVVLTELLTLVDDAVIMIDDDFKILFFNQGAEKMFGYEHRDMVGLPLDLLLPDRLRKTHRQHIKRFSESNVSARHMSSRSPIVGLHQDGREFNAEASIAQMELGEHKVFMVIMRDITWKEELEQHLNQTAENIHNLNIIMERLDDLGHKVGYRLAHPRLLEEAEGAHRKMLEKLEEDTNDSNNEPKP